MRYSLCVLAVVLDAEIRINEVNLALQRPASQSSTLFVRTGQASRATDGNAEASTIANCAHTSRERNPWWLVDLGHPVSISAVRLTGQRSESVEYAQTVDISISEDDQVGSICATDVSLPVDGVGRTHICFGTGRFLFVLVRGYAELVLCEVEVIPVGPKGVAHTEVSIGEPFDVTLAGHGFSAGDRIRIIDPELECGSLDAESTVRLIQPTVPVERSDGNTQNSRWRGMILTHRGFYKICYCSSNASGCKADEDFSFAAGVVFAIGKLAMVAEMQVEPHGVAVIGDEVYWTEPNRLLRMHLVTLDQAVVAGSVLPFSHLPYLAEPVASARFHNPTGLCVANDSILYVVDTLNHMVHEITLAAGTISTVAGGSGELSFPAACAYDALSDNLFISDAGNHVIRVLEQGSLRVVAGILGDVGHGRIGRVATQVPLRDPQQLSVRYVNDTLSSLGFAGAAACQQVEFADQGFLAGVVGNGSSGFLLNETTGGALSSMISRAKGFVFDQDVALIGDTENHRIVAVALPNMVSLGCWEETPAEALVPLLDNAPSTLYLCVFAAIDRGYDVAALRDGKCASSANALYVFQNVGESNTCVDGRGSSTANSVYYISLDLPREVLYRPFTIVGRGYSSISTKPTPGNLPFKSKVPSDAWRSTTSSPKHLAVDNDRNLFFTESGNHQMRMMFGFVGPYTTHEFKCSNRNPSPCTLVIRGNALMSSDRIAFVRQEEACGSAALFDEFPIVKAEQSSTIITPSFRKNTFLVSSIAISVAGTYRVCYCPFINLVNRWETPKGTSYEVLCGSTERGFAFSAGLITITGPNALQSLDATVTTPFTLYIFGDDLSEGDRIRVFDGSSCGSSNVSTEYLHQPDMIRSNGSAAYSAWENVTLMRVGTFIVCWCANGASCVAEKDFHIHALTIHVGGASAVLDVDTTHAPFNITLKGRALKRDNRLRFVSGIDSCGCTTCESTIWPVAPCRIAMSQATWCNVAAHAGTDVSVCWCDHDCESGHFMHVGHITLPTASSDVRKSAIFQTAPHGCAGAWVDGLNIVGVTLVTRATWADTSSGEAVIHVSVCSASTACLSTDAVFSLSSLQESSVHFAFPPSTSAPETPFIARFIRIQLRSPHAAAWLGDRAVVDIAGSNRSFPLSKWLVSEHAPLFLATAWVRAFAPPWATEPPTTLLEVRDDECGGCPSGTRCSERRKTAIELVMLAEDACSRTTPQTIWQCAPVCGDGAIVGSETCDDGNTQANDGCSSRCEVENGFVCEIESQGASTCKPILCDGNPSEYDPLVDGQLCSNISDSVAMCYDLDQACAPPHIGEANLACPTPSASWACQHVEPRPRATQAIVTDFGRGVSVVFDSPVHIVAQFGALVPCKSLFTDSSLQRLGQNALCMWTSEISLFVTRAEPEHETIGRYSLEILESALSHRSIPVTPVVHPWKNPFQLVPVQEELRTPQIDLRAARINGRCQPILWDVSSTGGRWVSVRWLCLNSDICAELQPWIDQTTRAATLRVSVPITRHQNFISESAFAPWTLRVEMTNVQGMRASASQEITFSQRAKIPLALPVVRTTQYLIAGDPLELEISTAQAFSLSCMDDDNTWDGIQIAWYIGGELVDTDAEDKRVLRLDSRIYSWSEGQTLSIVAVVMHTSPEDRNEVHFTVHVRDRRPQLRSPLWAHKDCAFSLFANGTVGNWSSAGHKGTNPWVHPPVSTNVTAHFANARALVQVVAHPIVSIGWHPVASAVLPAFVPMAANIDDPDCHAGGTAMFGGFLLVGRVAGVVASRKSLIAPARLVNTTYRANISRSDLEFGMKYTFQCVFAQSLELLHAAWPKFEVDRHSSKRALRVTATLATSDSPVFSRQLGPLWGNFSALVDRNLAQVALAIKWRHCVLCRHQFSMTVHGAKDRNAALLRGWSFAPHVVVTLMPGNYTFQVTTSDISGVQETRAAHVIITEPPQPAFEESLGRVEELLMASSGAYVPDATVGLVGDLAEQVHRANGSRWRTSAGVRANVSATLRNMAAVLDEALMLLPLANHAADCEEMDEVSGTCAQYSQSTVDRAAYALMRIVTAPAELILHSVLNAAISAVVNFVARCIATRCVLDARLTGAHHYALGYFLTVCSASAELDETGPLQGMHCAHRLGDALAHGSRGLNSRRSLLGNAHVAHADALGRVVLGVSVYARDVVGQHGIEIGPPSIAYPTVRITPFLTVDCLDPVALVTIKWAADPYSGNRTSQNHPEVIVAAYDVALRACGVPARAVTNPDVRVEMMVGTAHIESSLGYDQVEPYQCVVFRESWSRMNLTSLFVPGSTGFASGIEAGTISDARVECDIRASSLQHTFAVEHVPAPEFVQPFIREEVYIWNLSAMAAVLIAVFCGILGIYAHWRDHCMGLDHSADGLKRQKLIFFSDLEPEPFYLKKSRLMQVVSAFTGKKWAACLQQTRYGYRSPVVRELAYRRTHGRSFVSPSVPQEPTMRNLGVHGYRGNARPAENNSPNISVEASPRSKADSLEREMSEPAKDTDLDLPVGWTTLYVGTQLFYRNVLSEETQWEVPECAAVSYLSNDELRTQLAKFGAQQQGSRLQREKMLNDLVFNKMDGRKFEGVHRADESRKYKAISPELDLIALRWMQWSLCALFFRVFRRKNAILRTVISTPWTSCATRVAFFAAYVASVLLACNVLLFVVNRRTPLYTALLRASDRSILDMIEDGPLAVWEFVVGILSWPIFARLRFRPVRTTIYGGWSDAARVEQLEKWSRQEHWRHVGACVVAVSTMVLIVGLTASIIPQQDASRAFMMWGVGAATWTLADVGHAAAITWLLRRARRSKFLDRILTLFPNLITFHFVLEKESLARYWELYYEQEKMLYAAAPAERTNLESVD